jgi:hypothetical protein
MNTIFYFTATRLGRSVVAGLLIGAGWGAGMPLAAQSPNALADVAVARFLVDIDGLESEDYPGEASGLLPRAIEGVRTARMVRDAAQTLDNPEGSPVKIAFDSMYAVVKANLATVGVRLLPVDTLRGSVPYLVGYPLSSAKKVAALESFERALEIEIDVEVPDQVTGSYAILGTGKSRTSGRPEMTLRVRMVDAVGQQRWRDKVRVRSKEEVELNERWLLGIRKSTEGPDASTLPVLTQQAMDKLIERGRWSL